ncbi:NAD(P)H-binding protein [Actinokineospora sp. G85]|uniref:NAD(P)H-binding protein n=1 Tax=Actinokineospora sp. G85 TaxID=3406626 RepID=UPI003C709AAF
MTILVTGATGSVGRGVVDRLTGAGAAVRATSRDPRSARLPDGVDVRAGDLSDPASFGDALAGVEQVFLFPEPSGVDGFLELAAAAGVWRVVLLSSAAISLPGAMANPVALMHLSLEQAVERSGLAHTFVRPGAFASNAFQWAPAIKAGEPVRIPYAEASLAPVHEGDIAAVAARVLLDEDHRAQVHEVTGPESLTQRQQAERLAQVLGRAVPVADLTGEEALAEMEKRYAAIGVPGLAAAVVETLAAAVGSPAPVTRAVEEVTGRPARAFAEWAAENQAAFTA